jgi:hypothetical protein
MSGSPTQIYAGDSFLRTWEFYGTSGVYDFTGCTANFGMVPAGGGATGGVQIKSTDSTGYLSISVPETQGLVVLDIPPVIMQHVPVGLYETGLKINFPDGTSFTEAVESIQVIAKVADV